MPHSCLTFGEQSCLQLQLSNLMSTSKKRVTLRDIACRANVSVASVSLALQNSPRISSGRKQEIWEICRETGYVRDSRLSELMAHLRHNRSKTIASTLGVVYRSRDEQAQIPRAGRLALLKGISEYGQEEGYGVDLFDLDENALSAGRLRKIIDTRGIGSLIVIPAAGHDEILEALDCDGLQVAEIGRCLGNRVCNHICPDYMGMMDDLMEFAVQRNCQRVGIAADFGLGSLCNRLLRASVEFRMASVQGVSLVENYNPASGGGDGLRAWVDENRPDLVIGVPPVYGWLEELGYEMPYDFGFASLDVAGLPERVAGLNHRYDLVGAEAVKVVIEESHFRGLGESPRPKTVVTGGSFVPAASIGERVIEGAFAHSLVS